MRMIHYRGLKNVKSLNKYIVMIYFEDIISPIVQRINTSSGIKKNFYHFYLS